MKIEGRLLLFDIVHPDGSCIPSDCKIDIPENVPIIKDFSFQDPNNCIGSASVSIDEKGLIFTGNIPDDFDTNGYPECSGYYTGVESTPGFKFNDERFPYPRIITSMALKCVGLVKKAVNSVYKYERGGKEC